jgi:hypothetical protein
MRKGALLFWLALLTVGLYLLGSLHQSSPADTVPSTASRPYNPVLRWVYAQRPDEIGSGTVKIAAVQSLAEIFFGFPYQGAQRGTLTLQDHPRRGESVSLSVSRGQFLCHSPCYTSVRFDSKRIWQYETATPEDGSSNIVFIVDYADFRNELQKADRVRMEALFYQEGMRVFDFDVTNLRW